LKLTGDAPHPPLAVSHPAGVRGLKLIDDPDPRQYPLVAPRRGAWIETAIIRLKRRVTEVAPRRGAWIETADQVPPSIVRLSRTPQGCVD